LTIYKGIEITRPYNLSPDLLRKYESWGLIPEAPRGSNNYRQYSELHKAFFETTRNMLVGFSWTEVAAIMKLLVFHEHDEAIMLAIEYQQEKVKQYKESKQVISQLRHSIEHSQKEGLFPKKKDQKVTIGEVAKVIDLPVSTLRVWEKEGLFTPLRGENGYRYFDQGLIDTLLVVKSLRAAGLSFQQCLDILNDLEKNQHKDIIHVLENRAEELKEYIQKGLKALRYLDELMDIIQFEFLKL